ncbi:MAG: InlB B-repeat-containing protein [Anaerotruncus massiliensis (ex Togo et al. 2019)]
MKRLLSMLLALAISCSYLSLAALAAEGEDETPKAMITYSVAEGGTLTINGTPHNAAEAVTTGPDGLPLPHTVTLPEGVDVAFSALPDASHTLAALTVTGLPVGTPAPVITNGMGTVKAVNGLQIHASFDILTYTVDVRQAPGGTISASGLGANGTAAANGSVTLAAAANENYEFSHFLVDGAQVTANPCTFTVTKDTAVSALFTANPVTHSVTVEPPVGGRIQVSGIDDAGLVADGAKITIAAEPDGSHTFGALLINGTDVGSATHGMEVHGDVTVSATFPEKAPETYSVSVTAGAGGSAAASDETGAPLSGPVTAGTRVTLTAQADETHTFSHFLIGGVQIAETPYTLTVNGAVSAEAVFAEKPSSDPSENSKPDNGGEGSNGIPTVQVSVNQPAAGGAVTQVAANGATLASGAFRARSPQGGRHPHNHRRAQ